ncbi:glycosyltransferase family 2 protein [Chryseobacterium pennipullorum]|uniref:Glycosyltransferase family 2 protein n=1 Tax=Chryseobacterium pennipullorum TaxID=2258963 RepID=A0A3D9AKP2_9FLAO|nr:glycosyltransferase [Chryseobacterium pennipullorum]REC41735.1 glycosyltransferase family 2 protein [Chryseobacterium pennipullorum]
MKLSICIPVFNFDVRDLIFDLKKEIETSAIEAEIIVIDDASAEKFKQINRGVEEQVHNFVFLKENIGRSKIRNLFLKFSTGEYLLFLDCDGKVIDPQFLKKYIQFIYENPETQVIYGGRKVLEAVPDQNHYLRWKFSVERENLPVVLRRGKSYLSFQTNNFVIKKEVLEKVIFNPEFKNYGYEDLLFAMDLKSEKIRIDHIDNAILNNDLEENSVYLNKVEESVESLSRMLKDKNLYDKLSDVKLVRLYQQVNHTPFKAALKSLFAIVENRIKENLLKGNVSLRYLDIYKLGLLIRKMA